ncbi:MAG: flagellar basal body L-ring protein FlgH [Gammaproteobacteria bacterium]|nr:flagellar basal body L-ring protein FlgH [Gammaproteobacteria bacterium]
MRQIKKSLLPLFGAFILTACATPPPKSDPAYAPVRPMAPESVKKSNGAIYQANTGMSLFEDVKARRVGDTLTVVLVEKTDASKKAGTNSKKKTGVEIEAPTILGSTIQFGAPGIIPLASNINNTLGASLNGNQTFSGEGDSNQSNSLNGRITVTVAEVLPNGNLVVRGEKLLSINQGNEYVRFSGIVRPVDVQRDNTVQSTLVANAKITYAGEGAIADANTSGWLARFFNSPWWPF